jgi:23S rRNA (cytidine2498-2'-O)-methyltransferase
MLPEHPFNSVYLAHPDFLPQLCAELDGDYSVVGNMVFAAAKNPQICFALDVWLDPVAINFNSISEAVKILRAAGRFWYLHPHAAVRRSRLIESDLRKCPPLPDEFPVIAEQPGIGVYTLLDNNTLVYATRRWKKSPLGFYPFHEDKKNPPNRAYLKLWEAISLFDNVPATGELAVDLGAAPGGWSYVMHSLGCAVSAVDKAALDSAIAVLPRMTYLQQSAFALEPQTFEHPIDWLLCDVACYPERTFALIQKWLSAGKAQRLIFTIKLQGETDLSVLKPFQEIPGARVLHLYHNKHEVTFIYPAPAALTLNWQS